jgi:Putative Ig domain
MFEAGNALLNSQRRFRFTVGRRVNAAMMMMVLAVVALITTLCAVPSHAADTKKISKSLYVYGRLPLGTVNRLYNAAVEVTGGNAPFNFSVITGTLPPGVSLNKATGAISGKPSASGVFVFEVAVSDSTGSNQGKQTFAVGVNGATDTSPIVRISVSPTSTTLTSHSRQQFSATIGGTSNTAVSWSATTGSIDANGLYTAPNVTSPTTATITTISKADSTKSASASITVTPAGSQALQITTASLPQGAQGNPYSVSFAATGGTLPYNWSISAGTAPPGTTMSANGDFGGTPAATGNFSFTVTVADAANNTATGNSSLTVTPPGNFDGPAELPRVTVPSTMADTPAPGPVVSLQAGGDLQAALNNAQCGETIQLQAGATFSGKFIVPAKNCDINHWIVIRTSAPDSALPAEGQRATPCYAGVASLVGRPQYACANPSNVMAKVQNPIIGNGPFQFADGASFYRFIGLEITRPAGTPGSAELVSGVGRYDHVVVDRSWLHGTIQDETSAGVGLNQATNVAVVDSYFSDFHCIAVTGACVDAHALTGGTSQTQDGPYKIQDNFLEASSEAIMFGGGAATTTPADIQIIGNHFWKPWQWMRGNANFIGGKNGRPFSVKNHLELKNAARVLIDSNLMENAWGGFGQTGYGILLTPKNQHTQSGSDVCGQCQVTDITIRYVHLSHAGGGIMMATGLSGNGRNGAPALAGTRWSIHDVLLDDISTKYAGNGTPFEIVNGWPTNPLNTVTIDHVTALPDSTAHLMTLGNLSKNAPMYGLVFTNNLVVSTHSPLLTNGGGDTNCAFSDMPITVITKCFTTYTFANNAFVAPPPRYPASTWPANNMFPQTIEDVAFMNYDAGNYELQSSSPYTNKGMDGKNLGADIVGLNNALANVE